MILEWKTIPGFEKYEVSNAGQVRRKPKELKPIDHNTGYKVVSLFTEDGQQKQVSIHKAVLSAFEREKEAHEVCRHLDGNKHNNCLNNLAWGTQLENIHDQVRHGTNVNIREDRARDSEGKFA